MAAFSNLNNPGQSTGSAVCPRRSLGLRKHCAWRAAVALLALAASGAPASAQTQQTAIPVPFASALAGNGSASTPSAACTTGIVNTDNSNYGDGCPAAQAALNAPQGAAVDKYGNVYFADYMHKQVRVVYNGGTALAAAITAANSGYTPTTHAAPSITPVMGDVYTLAGTGAVTTALPANGSGYECASSPASSAGLNALGDGCPGAAATVGPRGTAVDSDGNVFIADYTNSRIRVLCVNCTNTQAAALITAENAGVTPVNGAIYTIAGYNIGYRDQVPGYSSANPGVESNANSLTVNTALLRQPTQAVLSANDDVFIADNLNNAVRVLYNGGTAAKNILTAEGYTPVVGSVYTVAGSGCVSAPSGKGGYTTSNECVTTTGSDTPALGTVPGASSTAVTGGVGTGPVWSVYLDPRGNVFYTDATNGRVKVLYAGIANPTAVSGTLQTGYTYSFAGQGTVGADGVAPSGIALAGAAAQGVGGDAQGDIFFTDYTNALFYETYAQTGITALIGGGSAQTATASGTYCNGGSTGPQSTDVYYNGCPLTEAKIASPRGPLVADAAGNLYFGDAASPDVFIRKFSYNPTFPATAVGVTSAAQPYAFTFLSSFTLGQTRYRLAGATTSEFSDAGNDTCPYGMSIVGGAAGTTCVFNVAFTPGKPGVRDGDITLVSFYDIVGSSLFGGTGLGAGLTLDPGTLTSTTGVTPNGIGPYGTGYVLVSDSANGTIYAYNGTSLVAAASAFTMPAGVAVDGSGNIFVADSSANTLTELPYTGGIRYTIGSGWNSPRGLAVDGLGNVYVADSGNNRIGMIGAGGTIVTTLGFTGLSTPQAVWVDAAGNVYAADSKQILKLTPTGVQSTVATGSSFTGVAVDAAGNVLVTTATTLVEYPASGTAAIALATGFTSIKGLGLDASGNALIADGGSTGYKEIQRTAGFYNFPSSPASTTVTLTSSGNQTLTPPTYTQSDTTDFSLTASTTNGCSGSLASGTDCSLTASFMPTASGTLTDNVIVGSNAVNASPITLTLTGTTSSQSTTTTLTVLPATLVYGNVETLTAKVAGSLQAPSNGTVNFYNNGSTAAFASAPVTSGQATYSFVPAVGSYSVTATYVPSGVTYSTSTTAAAQTFTVTPAPLTVTANNASRTYGSANPAFTYTITGFVNNDTQASAVTGAPNETTTATTTSNVGTYPITITQGSLAAANYTFATFVNGTLTVSGSTPQTITFAALPGVTYGVAPITLTATASSGLAVSYTVTGPATVSGSTLTITGAGTVSVTANQTGNNTYQAAQSVTQTFTVAKAPLTFTATSLSRTYGSANPSLSYTVTGFVNADSQATATTGAPTETTTATASSGVGNYPITLAAGTLAAPNYTFNFVAGTLTVQPANLTLTAANATRAYGSANPTFTGTLSGAVNGDTLTETFTTTAAQSSPVGSYAIVPGVSGANAANYSLTVTNGTLTVTPIKPVVGVTVSPTTGFSGTTTITLTATFVTGYGTPTGTVTFYSNGVALSPAAMVNTTGTMTVATLPVTTLPAGSDLITAVYSGDTNFVSVTGTGPTVTIAAAFGATSSTTAFAFQPNYQEAQGFLSINPGGRTDTLSFACVGLPAKISCAFSPSTLALSGVTATQTVQVLISNSGASASLRGEPGMFSGATRSLALAALPVGALLLLGMRRRRSLPMLLAFLLLSAGAVLDMSGCGASPTATEQSAGTYTFTINVNSGSTTLQSIPCTLTIP